MTESKTVAGLVDATDGAIEETDLQSEPRIIVHAELGVGSGEIKTLNNLSKMPNRDATGSLRSFGPTPSSGSSG
jgi:hypothetical protein